MSVSCELAPSVQGPRRHVPPERVSGVGGGSQAAEETFFFLLTHMGSFPERLADGLGAALAGDSPHRPQHNSFLSQVAEDRVSSSRVACRVTV